MKELKEMSGATLKYKLAININKWFFQDYPHMKREASISISYFPLMCFLPLQLVVSFLISAQAKLEREFKTIRNWDKLLADLALHDADVCWEIKNSLSK